MLAALLACACPTFAEMEVVPVDESATEAVVDQVAYALAGFAAWTGDAGVCVPEIRVQEDLSEPDGEAWDGWEVGGRYSGPRAAIRVDSDSSPDLRTITFHELCHAADHEEGHSDALSFPMLASRELFHGAHAVREDFAIACEGGPVDPTLDDAIVEDCGTQPVLNDSRRYISDVVFPAAPRMVLGSALVPATGTQREWAGFPTWETVDDAVAYDEGIAILSHSSRNRANVRLYDPSLATPLGEVLVNLSWSADRLELVASDGLPYLRATLEHQELVGLFELDPSVGASRLVPILDLPARSPLAVSDGRVYAMAEGHLRAWTLDGVEEALPSPVALFGDTLAASQVWPEDDGIGFFTEGRLGRFHADTGEWTAEAAPGTVDARIPLGDGRALVIASWAGGRLLVYEDGVYSPVGDLCHPVGDDGWMSGVLVAMDGHLLELSSLVDDATGDVTTRLVTEFALAPM